MRKLLGLALLAAMGCGSEAVHDSAKDAGTGNSMPSAGMKADDHARSGGAGKGAAALDAGSGQTAQPATLKLPQVYPLVRASTPTALISDPAFKSAATPVLPMRDAGVGVLPQALGGAVSLATAIQERFYAVGPTELLRIVHDLDDRVASLDLDPSHHACLASAPVSHTYALPGGQTFGVKLQCLQNVGVPGSAGAGWVALGSDRSGASGDDAGTDAADGGIDDDPAVFYLVEGQEGGMGGAYRIQGDSVEGWIAVADSTAPLNSRVIMHLITHVRSMTTELALAGAAVGFCSAHLRTSADHLFIEGKTNAAPPAGAPMPTANEYCDASRAGCFAAADLNTDLGAEAEGCGSIARSSFEIHSPLDASSDPGANVAHDRIYTYFNRRPEAVPAY